MIVQGLQRALPPQAIVTGHALESAWTRGDGRVGLRFSGVANDVVADRVVFALPFTVLRDLRPLGLRVVFAEASSDRGARDGDEREVEPAA